MLELAVDVGDESARAVAEEIVAQPAVAKLLLHEIEELERRLRGANPARGLEADRVAGSLEVLADHAAHDDAEGDRRVDAFLARGGLDEVGAGLHRDQARPRHVAERGELT